MREARRPLPPLTAKSGGRTGHVANISMEVRVARQKRQLKRQACRQPARRRRSAPVVRLGGRVEKAARGRPGRGDQHRARPRSERGCKTVGVPPLPRAPPPAPCPRAFGGWWRAKPPLMHARSKAHVRGVPDCSNQWGLPEAGGVAASSGLSLTPGRVTVWQT